ncbi:MAG: hypothetical protein ACPGEF_02440 [Endozoicomonas sp.]
MRFTPEEAIPIALALLDEGFISKGQNKPEFLKYLIFNAEWVEQRSFRQRNNHFALRTEHDQQNFLAYMEMHFGNNWSTSLEKDETREDFLNKRLLSTTPAKIHSRVLNAIWGEHSKKQTAVQPATETLDSELIQIRTQMSCQLQFSGRVINCQNEMAYSNAVIINEVALGKL